MVTDVEVKRGRPAKPPARSRSIYPTDALWDEMRRIAVEQNRSITATWEEAARLFLAVNKIPTV